jgi:hypothetical protein
MNNRKPTDHKYKEFADELLALKNKVNTLAFKHAKKKRDYFKRKAEIMAELTERKEKE